MNKYINNLKTILEALDSLSLVGYKNCQTYSNCMLALSQVINTMTEEENNKAVEAAEEIIVDEE